MIHVCYSNRTEELLAELVRRLEAERAGRSPFDPLRVVVPNRNVETYLKLGLAQLSGIAANLETHFLRTLLARLAEQALPHARAVQMRHIEGHLLALLHDPQFLAAEELAPVRDYLEAAGRAPDAVDRRRAQLAAELARLFDEYATSRPEMTAAWTAGRRAAGVSDAAGGLDRWQGALWRGIFGADGLVAQRSAREGRSWLLLGDLLARAEASGALAATFARGAPALHVFGLSYMARGYHRMIAELGRHLEVRIYTLNPCREFWEDLETVSELRRRIKKEGRTTLFPQRQQARQPALALGDDDPLGLLAEAENLPLRLWGRPGRESVRLLNQLTDGDFEGRFAAHPPGARRSLLARLQDDIVDRVARPAEPAAADGSITVLRCPGLRRELEVVAAEIWRMMKADPGLRFNEIAVVVPEARKEAYLPHVGAVFGEAHGLPHNVVDLPLGGGHRLGEAVELLLELPLGSFSRRELLPLLTHPSILGRFPEASAGEWLRLADELGIVHGADRQDHAGTYIERDLFSWDQGLRRLALGALMAGPRAGDPTPVTFAGQQYLPADLPPDEEPGALSFALLVRSLLADARFAAGQTASALEPAPPRERPLDEWVELIRGMLASYLVPADDEEEALLGRCLRALEELDELDLGGARVSYRVAAELARAQLGRLGGARGGYLAHGVTVASLVPMRAIPFRVVFVLGLGHGLFPAPPRHGQLDLRALRRAPGDVSPREQDLYMFLETILCARERLILSYVARDELTGEALPPSSVLLELRELLGDGYLDSAALAALFDDAPAPALRRYDDGDRLGAAPLAHREQLAKELGRSLRESLPPDAAPPSLAALARALPPELGVALTRHLRLQVPPLRAPGLAGSSDPSAAGKPRLVIPLIALRRFLEDPLQGSARFRLRMRELEGDEDLIEREEEAFETDGRGHTGVLRAAMTEALLADPLPRWEAVLAAYQRLALREELSGRFPTGLFRDAGQVGHEAILRGWFDELSTLASGAPMGRRVVRFGPAGASGAAGDAPVASEARDPILLEVEAPDGPIEVELVGRTELLLAPAAAAIDAASLVLICRNNDDLTRREKDRLRAYLDHLALSAGGISGGAHVALIAWSRGGQHALHRDRFAPVAPARARAQLAALVADLLAGTADAAGRPTGVHDYLLPCDAVFEARRAGRPVAGEVERLRDAYFEKPMALFSSVLGPVPEAAERHDPPRGDEAERMVGARFGLYFELLEEEANP